MLVLPQGQAVYSPLRSSLVSGAFSTLTTHKFRSFALRFSRSRSLPRRKAFPARNASLCVAESSQRLLGDAAVLDHRSVLSLTAVCPDVCVCKPLSVPRRTRACSPRRPLLARPYTRACLTHPGHTLTHPHARSRTQSSLPSPTIVVPLPHRLASSSTCDRESVRIRYSYSSWTNCVCVYVCRYGAYSARGVKVRDFGLSVVRTRRRRRHRHSRARTHRVRVLLSQRVRAGAASCVPASLRACVCM